MDSLVYLLAGIVTVLVLSVVVGGVAAFVVAFRQPTGRAVTPARVPAVPTPAPSVPAPARHREPEPAR